MIRQVDTIDVKGVNADFCRISPPGLSWGPELAPGSKGLFDMPIETNWGRSSFGQFFQSWRPKRRDVQWTIHIKNPDTGTLLDGDSDLWHTIYSRWKAMFAPDREATIIYTSVDGERTLKVRTVLEPQPFTVMNFEGGDPHLWAYGSVVQTQAAELPFYVGKSDRFAYEIPGSGNFWFPLPYFNPGSVDIWPIWELTGGAQWVIPDYSFGSEAYGRGISDLGKTVAVPNLLVGENVTVMTRPDKEWILSEWETLVTARSKGKRSEYPILPGHGSPDDSGPNPGCIVRALNVVDGAAATLELPRWYAEPFSTPRIA